MKLAEFSVRQTVLVNLLFFVCVLGGLAAFNRIPVEFFPDVTLNSVVIVTPWTGASAEEVERLVTQKLEEELGTVTDIHEMRSTSQADISQIDIDFDEMLDDQDYEAALNDVRAALDRVKELPADAEKPMLREILSSEFPSVMIAVVDSGGVGEIALREVARDIRRRAERIPGANRVEIRGFQEREIRILVDRDAAARYGLTVGDVAERIRRQNMNLPAGTFATDAGEATLRARGDYQSVEQILDTVVRENANGTFVRVSEIAQLEEGLEKRRFVNRYNAQPAQVVSVTKKDDADVIELSASIDRLLEDYRKLLPAGIEIYKTLDTAAFVAPRMSALAFNLMTGIVLVVAILWFTIGFRNSILTSIAIPFSFLTAMIFFPLLDISINSSTLIAMLLVSGMLVDDAIIVLENVYRRIESGEALRDAVVNGTQEVLWPVLCAVLTTCAAFAPLLLVGGTAGKFVSVLPKCVLICLLASLFECLIVLPAHYLDFGSRRSAGTSHSSTRQAVERAVVALRHRYERALDVVLQHRFSFGVLTAAVLVFATARASHLPVDLFPGEFDTFTVLIETPPDFDLDRTDQITAGIEREILAFVGDDIVDFSTTVGRSQTANYDSLTGPHVAISFLVLAPTEQNISAPDRTLLRVRERLETYRAAHPEGIVDLRVMPQQNGPPTGPPVEVRIQGEDYALGKSIAEKMQNYLRTQPGVYNVEDNLKLGPSEVRLFVDEERASKHGLGFEDLADALRGANDGLVVTSFRDPANDEDIDIRVMLRQSDRRDLQDLLDVELRTPRGYLLKLRDVASVDVTRGFRSYRRYDEKRTVSVYASVDEEITSVIHVNQNLQARFADVEKNHPEVDLQYGGEYAEGNKAFADVFRIFPIAFLVIYMILATLFKSYLQPLVVTVAIPFAFVGVVTGVDLMNYNVSFLLFYATIGLTGVVVNDSLVMVDFINRARATGVPLLESVRRAGSMRLRPILLTTLTTVLALLPMTVGLQGSSKTYGPFAAAISFGLIVAMFATLFVVPMTYTSLILGADRLRDLRRDPWALGIRLRGLAWRSSPEGGAGSSREIP